MQTGTLKELNLKPGDVVQVVGGKSWEIVGIDNNGNYLINDPPARHLSNTLPFRIISRAPDTPKLWRDMTPEEKGALLLAAHEGKVVECWYAIAQKWVSDHLGVGSFDGSAYRIRHEPVRDTRRLYYYENDEALSLTLLGTIDLIDGKPDPASIRMDEI